MKGNSDVTLVDFDDDHDQDIGEEALVDGDGNDENVNEEIYNNEEVEEDEDEEEEQIDDDDDGDSVYEDEEKEKDETNETNDNNDNDDYYGNDEDDDDFENDENNNSSDGNLLMSNQQSILDNWSEGVEIDPDDPTLTKEQKLTLALMIKCRCLINMIRKSSVLTLYFNRIRGTLKIQRNVLRDVCTRWNSSYIMMDSLKIVRPILEHLYNDKHDLNITNEQIEKLNELEITSTEWNYLNQLHHVLKVFHKATRSISGKNYPTIGAAYFILTKLKKFLTSTKNDNSIVKNLKTLLLRKITHYFEEDPSQLNILKVSKDKYCYYYYKQPMI